MRNTNRPARTGSPDRPRSPLEMIGLRRRRLLLVLSIGVILTTAGLALFDAEEIRLRGLEAWAQLCAAPAPVYFTVLTIALLAPVPASLLYVAAGPIFGIATSLAWIVPALLLNSLLVYGVGTTALRPALLARFARHGRRLPTLSSPSDALLFMLLVRVTPGIPYFIQSWTLVLSGVPLIPFVLISVLVQMVYATGFVVLGRAAFEGRLGVSTLTVAFLIAAGLCARAVRGRLRRPRPYLNDRDTP